jgi:hypothetical protein
VFQKLHHPLVIQFTKEISDIRIQNPIYLSLRYPHPDPIQRIMHTAFRAKTVTEAKEHLLIDLRKQLDHSILDYLILQCSNANRTLSPIFLRHIGPFGGFGSVAATVDPIVQIG